MHHNLHAKDSSRFADVASVGRVQILKVESPKNGQRLIVDLDTLRLSLLTQGKRENEEKNSSSSSLPFVGYRGMHREKA